MSWQAAAWLLLGGSTALMFLGLPVAFAFLAINLVGAAIFLGGDAGMMSCIGNDFSFDDVFARPLSSLGAPGDVLVCFTTSGDPENVLRALEVARQRSIDSLALLGKGGGRAGGLATWDVVVESVDTARIQEAHQFILHWICDRIEEAFPVS
ncbi:MAG TPA: hypothetical protein VIG06_06215 [Kofleriaceae bacterium]